MNAFTRNVILIEAPAWQLLFQVKAFNFEDKTTTKMNSKPSFLSISALIAFALLLNMSAFAQHDHDHEKNPHQLPSGQYGNVPHYDQNPGDIAPPTYEKVVMPPVPFDSAMDTKISGEVKRTDGETYAVFHLKTEPMPANERRLTNGSKFLLLNEWLTPKRSFQKILVKVISNPPSNQFVGDTGWIELSHTSLYQFYDNDLNKIDKDYVYKKYLNAAVKFRKQSETTTCPKNKKCYEGYAKYYDCMAQSEKDHVPAKCKMKNCTIVDCPGDAPK
jgi:hypothetical protein